MSEIWKEKFSEFLNAKDVASPPGISLDIREKINRELNPSVPQVFLKLAISMAIAGGLTMLVCPQFGIGGNYGAWIMKSVMQYGMSLCHFACGAFFSGTGILAALFLLRPEEIRVLRKTKILQLGAVSALSLALFVCIGSAGFTSLEILWFIGAFLGSLLSLEAGVLIRSLIVRSVVES